MLFVYLLCLFSVVNAAPQFSYEPCWRCNDEMETFDTQKFWLEMEKEMQALNEMIRNLRTQTTFREAGSNAGVVGNQYKIAITLSGYTDGDIVVKARDGVLMVQAVHKVSETYRRNYLEIRTLPATVDANGGVWAFDNNVLTITFPLQTVATTEKPIDVSTEAVEFVTKGYESREEMDKSGDSNNQDADVGILNNNKDSSKETAVETNEIRGGIEATTYAVDLKNEVEFVPVYYRK